VTSAAGGGRRGREPTTAPARVLDLRGVGCPLNYVKTRVALDAVEPGECVEVWLDHGEPEENVPRSCEEDGFPVLVLEESAGGYVRVVVARPQ
jgi:TusA-related sulfurtransferase